MDRQQIQHISEHWSSVTYYVVTDKGPKGKIIGPGFKTVLLARAWRSVCRLWAADADFTFLATNAHSSD